MLLLPCITGSLLYLFIQLYSSHCNGCWFGTEFGVTKLKSSAYAMSGMSCLVLCILVSCVVWNFWSLYSHLQRCHSKEVIFLGMAQLSFLLIAKAACLFFYRAVCANRYLWIFCAHGGKTFTLKSCLQVSMCVRHRVITAAVWCVAEQKGGGGWIPHCLICWSPVRAAQTVIWVIWSSEYQDNHCISAKHIYNQLFFEQEEKLSLFS